MRQFLIATVVASASIVASILAFSSPSLATSDEEELGKLGDKMSAAFKCSAWAGTSHNQEESQRLFQIGLKAGRDFVEGIKSTNDPKLSKVTAFARSASTDFVVGSMWENETTKADEEVRNELPSNDLLNSDVRKNLAERSYHNGNCSLIN